MIRDFSRVQSIYLACSYTNMKKSTDGLNIFEYYGVMEPQKNAVLEPPQNALESQAKRNCNH